MLIVRNDDNVLRLIDTDPPEFGRPDGWPDFDPNFWHLTGGPCHWDAMLEVLLHDAS